MTIPTVTPYTGEIANPDGSQTQTEFTQNMFDQLSFEKTFVPELNNSIAEINNTASQVDTDATNAAQSASDAQAAANSVATVQFVRSRIGNISDYVGDTLTESDRFNIYQYPDDSDYWYGVKDSEAFPVTIPADPSSDDKWTVVNAASEQWVSETVRNPNLLSNHNFLTPSPDAITHPSATPTDYVSGTQVFSGVFVESDVVGLTYVNGRVKWINPTGAIYLSVPNTNGLEYITEFTASVADFDGKPRDRGVSFALVGDEYRVTVGVDALSDGVDDTPLGSVKFEQGKVATGHDVSTENKNFEFLTDAIGVNLRCGEVISTKSRSELTMGQGGGKYVIYKNSPYQPNGGTVVDLGGKYALAVTDSGQIIHSLPSANIHAAIFNIKLDGSESITESTKMIDWAIDLGGVTIDMGTGTHEMGDNNYPIQNSASSGLKDCKGLVLKCHGDQTIIKTTSNDGADVFQLNAVKNFKILGYPKVTATLTDTIGAGSNGCSVTNGFDNIELELNCVDLPFVEYPTYGDGGKALTIQPGTSANPARNLVARIRYNNVLYGFGMDINSENTISNPFSGVDVTIFGEDCYRSVVLSATEPSSNVPLAGLGMGVKVRGTSINARQHITSQRFWGQDIDVFVMDTKTKSQMNTYLANDPDRYATKILAAKNSNIKVSGSVSDVDTLHLMGGASYISPNTTGQTINSTIHLNVDFSLASEQLDIVNFGGWKVANSLVRLTNVTNNLGELASEGNTVIAGGSAYSRDLKVVNTFELLNDTGDKKFGLRSDGNIQSPLTTSSAIGAYVGKKAEYDESGVFLGYRPLYL